MKTNQTDLVIFNKEIIVTVKTTTQLEKNYAILQNLVLLITIFSIGLVIRSIEWNTSTCLISNSVLKEEDTPDIRRGKAKEDSPYLQSRHLLSTNKCMHGMRALGVPFQTCMDGSIRLSEMLGLIGASQPDRLFFFQNCTFFNWFSFIGETIVFYFAVKVRGNTLHNT